MGLAHRVAIVWMCSQTAPAQEGQGWSPTSSWAGLSHGPLQQPPGSSSPNCPVPSRDMLLSRQSGIPDSDVQQIPYQLSPPPYPEHRPHRPEGSSLVVSRKPAEEMWPNPPFPALLRPSEKAGS